MTSDHIPTELPSKAMIEAGAEALFAVTAEQIGKPGGDYVGLPETAKQQVRSAVIAIYLAMQAARTPSQVDEVRRLRDAFDETLQRYPDAQAALVFFWVASGLGAGELTAEHLEWARQALASSSGG